jgi:hypothetical protein
MDARDETKLRLDDLIRLWDERAASYSRVLCGAALTERDNVWRIVLAFFLPLHKTAIRESALDTNYGNFRITKGSLPLGEAKKVLEGIVNEQTLALPNLPKVPVTASLNRSSMRRVMSVDKRYPVSYPFFECRFSLADQCQDYPPQGPLYLVDLPTYPRGDVAIKDLLKVHLGDISAYRGEMVALAPDYRAKLAEVRLSTKGLQARIECLSQAEEEKLVGKLYYETSDGQILHRDLQFAQQRAGFEAPGFPRHVVLGLLSKTDGGLIDQNSFYAGVPYAQPGIVLEASEEDVERLVLAGESGELEFKRELPRDYNDFALEAAAFANANGGRILIGVDNNGVVVGFTANKGKETVANIFRDYCEPQLEFAYEEVAVQGKTIVVLTVQAGKRKPYVVRDRGVYVRSGATKRVATRYELDQMCNKEGVLDDLLGRAV